MKDSDGETRRERNVKFEVDCPDIDVPENGHFLWDWFWDLRQSQAPGFSGPSPISNQEIIAWASITGNILRREEAAVIKQMDSRYCREISIESEAIREREAS